MIREKMYEKVQLFKRLGYSRSKISSDLEIGPKTVTKYYVMDEGSSRLTGKSTCFGIRCLKNII